MMPWLIKAMNRELKFLDSFIIAFTCEKTTERSVLDTSRGEKWLWAEHQFPYVCWDKDQVLQSELLAPQSSPS